MKYLVYSFAGRPILAIQENSRQFRISAWERYQPFTIKRMVVQRLMQFMSLLNLDGLLCQLQKSPFGKNDSFAFQDWLDQVRHEIGSFSAQPVVVWPPQEDRGRVYVHFLNQVGQPIGFAKVSLDGHNSGLLSKEAHTLRILVERQLQTFRVPNVISDGLWRNHVYLVEEPLPLGARPVSIALDAYPESCIDELGGSPQMATHQELESFTWWNHFGELANGALRPFWNELRQLVSAEGFLPVCRVHGDLGPANLVRVKEKLWLFDWEESTEHGPVLSDKIGYDLAVRARAIKKRPKQEFQLFCDRHLRGADSKKRRDVMAALAFRHTFAPSTTQLYIQNWNTMILLPEL